MLVAIGGVPGGGKTTLAGAVAEALGPRAMAVSADGFHIRRALLTPDQVRRRGAPDTFDTAALRRALRRAHSRANSFAWPAFDHAAGDPDLAGGPRLTDAHTILIIDGLYLLLDRDAHVDWLGVRDLFDVRCLVQCELSTVCDRLVARHVATGTGGIKTEAEAWAHVNGSDAVNARFIQSHSTEEMDVMVDTT